MKAMQTLIYTFGIMMAAMLFVCNPASADAVIEYDNGYTVTVPEGWVIDVRPEGFNMQPYDASTNPQGKLAGWGGWPWFDLYLQHNFNCYPDEVVTSPATCPPLPEIRQVEQCYFEYEPEPEPEKCPGGELVISPNECDPDA